MATFVFGGALGLAYASAVAAEGQSLVDVGDTVNNMVALAIAAYTYDALTTTAAATLVTVY